MPRRLLPATLALTLVAGATAAQTWSAGPVTAERPWARETAPTQRNGVAYLALRNDGATPDRLVGARSDRAAEVELHRHTVDAEGVARMRPVEAVELPAHGSVALEPGGLHLMLVDLARPLRAGERVPVTLVLERAGTLSVEVEVLPLRAPSSAAGRHDAGPDAPGDHGSHGTR